jgi:hypothetical protein
VCIHTGVVDTLVFAMARKEHPAAKAGRYVRAAGIVLGKEIDRRATAAAARPAPAAPALPPPPPPAVPTAGLLGKAQFALFMTAVVSLVVVILHAPDVVPGTAKTVVRILLGAIMLLEAALLTSNWKRANERIGQRLLTRVFGIERGARNRRERLFARIVRDGLTLLGIAFLAAGVFSVLVGAFGIDT